MRINVDAVPGTVHLVDEEGTMHAQHDKRTKEIVLSPTPSSHPDDPLNWSYSRKILAMFCVTVYAFVVGVPSAAIYSIFEPVNEKTGLSIGTLNQGTGYMFLFFGLGCFITQPLALQYGKRPVYLFSVLATTLIILWAPKSTSNGTWIAGKILQGFFGAPIEALCEASVADIWFEHDRGSWMTVYGISLCVSNFIAPAISGFIADGQSWEWVMYWCSIFGAVSFVFLFFFMEETSYSRKTIAADDTIDYDSDNEQTGKDFSNLQSAQVSTEKGTQNVASVDMENGDIYTTYTTKTFWQKLKIFDTSHSSSQLWINFMRPFTMFKFPVIYWSGFYYGTTLIWFNVLNGTASLILTSVYKFSPAAVGLTYFSPIIGSIIGSVIIGVAGDRFKIFMARRNGGIYEPEQRLWLAAPFVVLAPASLILWGVGAAQGIHWIGPVIGMAILGASVAAGCTIPINYFIDCYRELGGPGLVPIIFIRNTMSFAVSYGITPWITNMGIKNCFISAAFIALACNATFLIVLFYGKSSREASKGLYWRYVKIAIDKGMAH